MRAWLQRRDLAPEVTVVRHLWNRISCINLYLSKTLELELDR